MEVKWYNFKTSNSSTIQFLINDIHEIKFRYPFLDGNSIFEQIEPGICSNHEHAYFFSINEKIALLGEFLQDKFKAIPCEKPKKTKIRFLYGDKETLAKN